MDESCPVIVRAILENLEDLCILRGAATELGSVRAVPVEDAISAIATSAASRFRDD